MKVNPNSIRVSCIFTENKADMTFPADMIATNYSIIFFTTGLAIAFAFQWIKLNDQPQIKFLHSVPQLV